MTELTNTPAIALDAGGTRCRLAYEDQSGRMVVEAGSANIMTNPEAAIAQVRACLNELCAKLGVRLTGMMDQVPAFFGLAGMLGDTQEKRLRAEFPFANLRVADDRPAALRGALGGDDGILAHCGTGSFFAAQQGADVRFVGGWGSVLGDEASAQWVGRHALKMVLRQVDGFLKPSALSERLLQHMNGVPGLVSFARDATPKQFGDLAPMVTDAAAMGDPIAHAVIDRAVRCISTTLNDLGWAQGMTICLTGGIGPHYAAFLPAPIKACLTEPKGTSIDGGLALARMTAKEIKQ